HRTFRAKPFERRLARRCDNKCEKYFAPIQHAAPSIRYVSYVRSSINSKIYFRGRLFRRTVQVVWPLLRAVVVELNGVEIQSRCRCRHAEIGALPALNSATDGPRSTPAAANVYQRARDNPHHVIQKSSPCHA